MALTMNQWLAAHPCNSRYGAPIGQVNDDIEHGTRVHVEKLGLGDGGYDRSGVYWGRSTCGPIWAIWCDDPSEGRLCIYCRFRLRREAVAHAVEKYELVPLRGNPKETK